MNGLIQTLTLIWLLASFPVLAQLAVPTQQVQGDVTFISGGVGKDEADYLQSVRADYNLNLLFATQNGDYLSGVRVNISDAKRNLYLDTVADGPMLFAQLKPGRYTVSAEIDGSVQHKKVNIGAKTSSLSFVWRER